MGARTLAMFAFVGTVIFLCICRLAAVDLQLGGTLDVGKLAVHGCLNVANAEIKEFCVYLDPDLTVRKMVRTKKQFDEGVTATLLSYAATLAFFPKQQQQAMELGSMIGMLSISMSPLLCCVSTFFTSLAWALSLTVVAISVVQADAKLHQEIVTALAIAWAIVIGLCLPSGFAAQPVPEHPPVTPKRGFKQDAEEGADINRRFPQNKQLQQQQQWQQPPRGKAVVHRDLPVPTHYQTHDDQDSEEDIDECIRQLLQQKQSRKRRHQTPPPRKQVVVHVS